ncbi:MAG: hypothetical protein R2874_13360 [Desulfobacterales bacterium]
MLSFSKERRRIELFHVEYALSRHLPVSIIMAPIMAGTPVVYDMAWDRTSS